ncbi:MAG: thioredoxin TrxC [Paralcaligenes sp.]
MSDYAKIACPACLVANRVPATRLGENPSCGKCGATLLDGTPIELSESQFEVFMRRTDLPVLVDFWAPWCGPCHAMAPNFERAAQQLRDHVRLVKVNIEEAQRLAARYAIRSIPTLVLFKNSVEVKRTSGAMDTGALTKWAT